MSGFDFDALRDPEAPLPGSRERAGVEARARQLRARSRLNRLGVAVTSLAAVVAIAFGVVAVTRSSRPEIVVRGASTSVPTTPSTVTPSSGPTEPTTLPATVPAVVETTTTLPSDTPSQAISASFVSADVGWVLEQDGLVLNTIDGGTTWANLPSVRLPPGDGQQIRFGDSLHGYVFQANGASTLLTTDDGGAEWQTPDTPFSTVSDIAISHGTVYVVGLPSATSPITVFRIWTAPVGGQQWSMQPIEIPPGAGPVPTQQLVLAGDQGWMVNVDRTVTSGARLSVSGDWQAWNPPCLTLNGPEYLAASTVTDVVATCDEHVWGGGPIASGIYFSHDGGVTFVRHDAPGYGPVTSPSPGTAVVGSCGIVSRTTDDGATWELVAKFNNPDAQPSDIGFTTPTQGFVIQGGQMQMTYDAGATWQRVTIP